MHRSNKKYIHIRLGQDDVIYEDDNYIVVEKNQHGLFQRQEIKKDLISLVH